MYVSVRSVNLYQIMAVDWRKSIKKIGKTPIRATNNRKLFFLWLCCVGVSSGDFIMNSILLHTYLLVRMLWALNAIHHEIAYVAIYKFPLHTVINEFMHVLSTERSWRWMGATNENRMKYICLEPMRWIQLWFQIITLKKPNIHKISNTNIFNNFIVVLFTCFNCLSIVSSY